MKVERLLILDPPRKRHSRVLQNQQVRYSSLSSRLAINLANVGLPQVHAGKYVETGLVTSGDDLSEIHSFLPPGSPVYSAGAVIAKLLAPAMASHMRNINRSSKV